jgi:hypothetical protein
VKEHETAMPILYIETLQLLWGQVRGGVLVVVLVISYWVWIMILEDLGLVDVFERSLFGHGHVVVTMPNLEVLKLG